MFVSCSIFKGKAYMKVLLTTGSLTNEEKYGPATGRRLQLCIPVQLKLHMQS